MIETEATGLKSERDSFAVLMEYGVKKSLLFADNDGKTELEAEQCYLNLFKE